MISDIEQEEFSKLLEPYILQGNVAVAVSGGADSMALVLLMHEWASARHVKIIALTVDHQLRPESAEEAFQVHTWLIARGIKHHTLVWQHGKVTSAIQKKAREARYQLLKDWCYLHQVKTLMTAHHLQDQWETFMMRLSKGSGLKGLCCIAPCTEDNGLEIIRPLLTVPSERLKKTLERFSQKFIQDPSNQNTQYERIRWRKLLPTLAGEGLTPENIGLTIERLQLAEDYLQTQVQLAFDEGVVVEEFESRLSSSDLIRGSMDSRATHENDNSKGTSTAKTLIKLEPFKQLHPEIAYRILSKLLLQIGDHSYPLPCQSMKRLYAKLMASNFIGATGGGCYLKRSKGGLIEIRKEQRKVKPCP